MSAETILIVDDDPRIQLLVRTLLTKEGYRVVSAGDGEEGLARAIAERPDLILLDVQMPRMDGWTLIRKLRSTKELAFVPVIFLTGLDTAKDRTYGYKLGADDYMPKPFGREELSLRVSKALLRRERQGRGVRDQAPAARQGEQTTFQGKISQFGLAALLTLMDLEQKSGTLTLTRLEPPGTGHVHLRAGRVLQANVEGVPGAVHAEAIYQMLTWPEGQFDFAQAEIEMNDLVELPTDYLLVEGARRIDESEWRT